MAINTYSYAEINEGFSGFFNFADDPTLRKFGDNAIWFGKITGTDATLKCDGLYGYAYNVIIDGGAIQWQQIASGELTLFAGLADEEHTVCIVVRRSKADTNNSIDTTETEVLTVTGVDPQFINIPFDYLSDPSFDGESSYSTAERPNLLLTPTYGEVTPWSYETGQVVFKSTCDEIWLYTDNTSVVYSVDGDAFVEKAFTVPNSDPSGTIRRAVRLSSTLNNTTEHTYRIWGGEAESFGIQGIACLSNGVLVPIVAPSISQKVMMLGGSVVEGSVGDYQGFTDTWHVGNRLDYLMTKAGLAGNPSPASALDFPSIITANGIPDVCIFGSSTNDAGTEAELQAVYESLINAILAEGVPYVICRGVVPYYSDRDNALNAAVTSLGLSNVAFISSSTIGTLDTSDGTHPTPIGYIQLADYEESPIDTIISGWFGTSTPTFIQTAMNGGFGILSGGF